MEAFERLVSGVREVIWNFGIPVGDQMIPFVVIALLGSGVYLTLKMGFIQLRHSQGKGLPRLILTDL